MMPRTTAVLLGLSAIAGVASAAAHPARAAARLQLAQLGDPSSPVPGSDSQSTSSGNPNAKPTTPGSAASGSSGNAGSTGSAPSVPAPNAAALPQSTGTSRNGGAALSPQRAATVPGAAVPPSISYGGPQTDVQPVYGSTMRDSGAGNGGVPVYGNLPGQPGSPINGTANAYYAMSPDGSGLPGQTAPRGRGLPNQGGATFYTQQPLGAEAYTRDQNGNLGGRGGYTAGGVYNGTAAQQNGVGYGSAYVQNARPVGGLLSTGVNASGPLRPYIPLNTSPSGPTNSGYGIPNGSRSTHMDGRGVQRVD